MLDGSCVTGGATIFPNQVDYIGPVTDKYDSVSAAYQQNNFGLRGFLHAMDLQDSYTCPPEC